MARFPGAELVAVAALLVGLSGPASAQGGWRRWDVHLRDGTRVEANPLGAPDSLHIAISLGAIDGMEGAIPRSRIDYIAAQTKVGRQREPLPGVKLLPPPTRRVCEDLVVRRDGRRTKGAVVLVRIAYSEGVIRQGGIEIDLRDVAYLKFAPRPRTACGRRSGR